MQKHCNTQQFWVPESLWFTLNKIPRVMKLYIFLLCCSIGLAQATNSYAQKATVSLNMQNQTVQSVLDEIENQSEFSSFLIQGMLIWIAGFLWIRRIVTSLKFWIMSLPARMYVIRWWIRRLFFRQSRFQCPMYSSRIENGEWYRKGRGMANLLLVRM